jgi:integrase
MNLSLKSLNSPHSRARYAAVWNDFDGPLTALGVMDYIARYRDRGAAPATCNVKLSALKFKARAEGADPAIQELKAIPVRGVRMGTWLSIEQVRDLLAGGSRLKDARDRCILALLAGCALRREELAGLEVAHVQTLDGRVVLLDMVGKGRRVRTVPVPSWANSALQGWLAAAGISKGKVIRRVWRGASVAEEGLTADHLHAIVKKAGKRIGVPQLAPHDLRRTFAKLALKGKADLTQIQLTLGHSSVAITDRYLNSTVDLENPACDAIKL